MDDHLDRDNCDGAWIFGFGHTAERRCHVWYPLITQSGHSRDGGAVIRWATVQLWDIGEGYSLTCVLEVHYYVGDA